MISRLLLIAAVSAGCSACAFSQEPAPKPQSHMRRAVEQQGGFMQGGMHHAVAIGVVLDQKVDAATHTITLRVGPMNLPANTSHMKMPQPADLIWTIPVTGWLLSYHRISSTRPATRVPGVVLHHVAFWNENRSDFLCPNKEEHHFRRRRRAHRLDSNPRLRLSRAKRRPHPRGNHDSQSHRCLLRQGFPAN